MRKVDKSNKVSQSHYAQLDKLEECVKFITRAGSRIYTEYSARLSILIRGTECLLLTPTRVSACLVIGLIDHSQTTVLFIKKRIFTEINEPQSTVQASHHICND